MGGFYGNPTTIMGFEIDKRYPNKVEMDSSANSDGVFIGRYVLIDYMLGPADSGTNYRNNTDKDTAWGNQDSTLWEKVFVDGSYKYLRVADLNGMDWGIQVVAPSNPPVAPEIVEGDSVNIRKLKMAPHWGFRMATKKEAGWINDDSDEGKHPAVDFYSDGFNIAIERDPAVSRETASVSLVDIASGESYESVEQYDTKGLVLKIPEIGYAISDFYDKIYGTDRKGEDSETPCVMKDVKEATTAAENATTAATEAAEAATTATTAAENATTAATDAATAATDAAEAATDAATAATDAAEAATDAANLASEKTVDILDEFYGKAEQDGNRPWDDTKDWYNNPPRDENNNILYVDGVLSKSKQAIDCLNNASTTAEKLISTFEKLDSNQIPFLIEKDNVLSFVGMTLQSGEGISFDYEYTSEPSDPSNPWTGEIKSIKISVNQSNMVLNPFPTSPQQ